MKIRILCIISLTIISLAAIEKQFKPSSFDLTIVGPVKWRDGLGRISIGLAETLKDEVSINHIRSAFWQEDDLPLQVSDIFRGSDKTPGNVAFFTAPLWWKPGIFAEDVPQESYIKIAYSMLESTAIPEIWVRLLNERFDLVVVPDAFYIDVYKNSGVKIPIYALPHGIYIEHLLSQRVQKEASDIFTFGMTGQFGPRKNQDLVVDAFIKEFRNEPQVRLRLHGRSGGSKEYVKAIRKRIRKSKSKSIELIDSELPDEECLSFFKSLDCYVLVSRGEGFSVTPREALALGIPCILSNNTAHKTICETNYVCAVPSDIMIPADYGSLFNGVDCGYNFNCTVDDVRKAMREVYSNYGYYKNKALESQAWVEGYLWKNLRAKYRNLVKPSCVILGDRDILTGDYIMTQSPRLYEKYRILIDNYGKNQG